MMIVAKALVFDTENKILVLRRSSSHPRYAHHSDFPGGEVGKHEKAINAVTREIKEESGLVISSNALHLVRKAFSPRGTQHLIFHAKIHDKQPPIKLSWEHDAYFWITLDNFLNQELPLAPDSYFLNALQYLEISRPAS